MFLRNIKSWEYFRLLFFFFFFFFTTSHLLPLIYRVCFLWIQKQEFHAVTQISIPSHTFPCASSLKAKKTQSFAWNLQLAWIIFFSTFGFFENESFCSKGKSFWGKNDPFTRKTSTEKCQEMFCVADKEKQLSIYLMW